MKKSLSQLSGRRIISRINLFGIPIALFCLLAFPMVWAVFTPGDTNFPENFKGDNYLISGVNNIRLHVFRDKIFKGLYVAENNWLVFTGDSSLDDIQNTNQFSQRQLDQLTNRVNFFCSEVTKLGIRLIIMVPPNKNTIYPEYLPIEIQPMNKNSRLDQFMAAWEDTEDCKVLDLRGVLLKAKNDYQVYHSTDTHWNDYGAFASYQELARVMKEYFSAINIHDISNYSQDKTERKGDLTRENFGNFDIVENAVVLRPNYSVDYLSRFYNSSLGVAISEPNAIFTYSGNSNLPDAVIFHDSFFKVLFPFLMDSFDRTYSLWSLQIDLDFVKKFKPDFLIIEITERNLELRLSLLPVLE